MFTQEWCLKNDPDHPLAQCDVETNSTTSIVLAVASQAADVDHQLELYESVVEKGCIPQVKQTFENSKSNNVRNSHLSTPRIMQRSSTPEGQCATVGNGLKEVSARLLKISFTILESLSPFVLAVKCIKLWGSNHRANEHQHKGNKTEAFVGEMPSDYLLYIRINREVFLKLQPRYIYLQSTECLIPC